MHDKTLIHCLNDLRKCNKYNFILFHIFTILNYFVNDFINSVEKKIDFLYDSQFETGF